MSFGEIFWAYSDVIAANHIKGFKFFSPPHLAWLAVIAAGVVFYTLAYRKGGEKTKDNLRQSMIAVYMQIIPVYFLDKAYDINYMFLMEHQDNPVLKLCWNLSGGKGGIPYIIALSVLVIVVMHVFYLLYKVREWFWKKGRKKEQ